MSGNFPPPGTSSGSLPTGTINETLRNDGITFVSTGDFTIDSSGNATVNGNLSANGYLYSNQYQLGVDAVINPISGGQSGLSAFWGLQLGGLSIDPNTLNLAPVTANIGAKDAFCVVVAPSTLDQAVTSTFTTLGVVKRAWQNGGYLQQWMVQNSSTPTDLTSVAKLDLSGKFTATQLNVSAMNTAPSSATDTGTTGEIRITGGFIYVCIATNTWVRAALSTW